MWSLDTGQGLTTAGDRPMINLAAGLILFSVVIALIFVLMAENLCWQERIMGGLLTFLIIWIAYGCFAGFYLVGTGLADLENKRHDARLEEMLR